MAQGIQPMLAEAALDRLTLHCYILETKCETYRLQDAKRRRRNAESSGP